MTFLQDQFRSLDTIKKIGGSHPSGSKPTFAKQAESKDESIAKAVALKAAVETISSMMTSGNGKIKKTMETALYGDEIINLSKQFETYLLGKEEEVKVDDSGVGDTDEDFDQEPF